MPPQQERGDVLKRTLDYWLGCPIAFSIGFIRRKRPFPKDIAHIGIIMIGAIGDALLASSIIHDLKKRFPHAHITAIVSAANRGIFDLIEGPDTVLIAPISKPWSAIQKFRQCRFDILIDTAQWPRITAIFAALSRSKFTLGFKTLGQSRHWAFDQTTQHSPRIHELDNFRSLLGSIGVSANSLPQFKADVFEPSNAPTDPPYVIFHPWASGYRSQYREWPTQNWTFIAQPILARGYRILITGGPQDQKRAELLADTIGSPQHVEILAGRSSLHQTARALLSASAVVSVNTGIMHIAALLSTPTVALHGPTDPRRWGPIGKNHIIVGPGKDSGCAYLNLGFEYPKKPPDCMSKISPNEVLQHLRRILSKARSNQPN